MLRIRIALLLSHVASLTCLPASLSPLFLRTLGHVARFGARSRVVDVGQAVRAPARRLGGREAGLPPRALQRRHPAVAALADAVRVLVVGDGADVGGFLGRLQRHDGGGPAAVPVRVEVLLFELVEVGAWVGGFVFEHLHEAVEARGQQGAEDGADPVDLGRCWVSGFFFFGGGGGVCG